jgi:hypothetical protein
MAIPSWINYSNEYDGFMEAYLGIDISLATRLSDFYLVHICVLILSSYIFMGQPYYSKFI